MRHACRRSILDAVSNPIWEEVEGADLRNRARRAMHVDAAFLHDILGGVVCQSKLVCVGLYPAQCDLDTLFEHVSKLACKLHTAASRHISHLDEKYAAVSTGTIGHETGHDTRTTGQIVSTRLIYPAIF